jgi:hypothetical protein
MRVVVALCWLIVGGAVVAADPPRVLLPDYSLERIIQQPEIVTPVGLAIDGTDRLLVIENHTHQRPPEYQGPLHDRIRAIQFDENGRARPLTTFFEGTRDMMSLDVCADGSVYVATRRDIVRLHDRDRNGVADAQDLLVTLETKGDYPHNGLSGLAFDAGDGFYFGLGENLGEPYRLVGSDGKSVSGAGEGGSVYHCRLDGSELRRIATGFWNPFGMTLDPHGRLFCVDNDPDASPPCRLIHVVPTGDYGYQFRYGRSGRHPLQAWNGELPGTLGMLAGTGEAPCEIIVHGGRLWVASWGDHRIETYELQPRGATFDARQTIVVQGGQNFRPVGLALASDGSIFFSDWVDRNYPVHAQGAIWRLRPTSASVSTKSFPALSDAERRAAALQREFHMAALDDEDPFIRQAAVCRLATSDALDSFAWKDWRTPRQKLGAVQALRWRDPPRAHSEIGVLLGESHIDLRLFALRMIADGRLVEWRSAVADLLTTPLDDPQLLSSALSVLAWLDQGADAKDTKAVETLAAEFVMDARQSAGLRTAALKYLPFQHEVMDGHLHELSAATDLELASEAIRLLALRGGSSDEARLREIAQDRGRHEQLRADAVAGLASVGLHTELLQELLGDSSAAVRTEAERTGRHLGLGPRVDSDHVDKNSRLEEWLQRTSEPGEWRAGRRIFFRIAGAHCYRCHQFQGRGNSIGPDLTLIHRRSDRKWLLESILAPSQEVAPRYAVTRLVTTDGRIFSALPLTGPGETGSETFARDDGTVVTLAPAEIESRQPLAVSFMPSGFDQQLTIGEIRDLVTFLTQEPGQGK